MQNKELINHFGVYRKSTTSAQTDGRIATDRPLCSGQCGYVATMPSTTKIFAYMKATRGKSPPLQNYWRFLEICVMRQFQPY